MVNAILAVCATEPEIGEPEYYHVSSGARNPLTFAELYVPDPRLLHRAPVRGRQPRRGPAAGQWQFPGASSVERLLSTSERAHRLADRPLAQAPRSDRTRKIAKDLDRTRVRLDFLRRYHSLYNEYAQSELHFVDDNTLALTNGAHPDDQDAFAFDTAVYDWKTYIEDVHCPSITAPVRRMDALRRKRGNRPTTMKDLAKDTAGSERAGHLRPGRHDHVHQRDRAVPVGPAARAAARPAARRVRPGAAPVAVLPPRRAARPRHVPAGGLPALQAAPTWPRWSSSSTPPWRRTC